ncbi:PilW family protein [[Acidovorax] ebreus]|uniref:Type IV pilus assembly protein PilW n=1 Tax=Acidovorax ebreus (strain TPSY) TaxID=535289 RepID=A0A9J9UC08_ACIET|nr:PilW family protein [[Acidovorax] ebreus]ACM33972.1 conserved hypothetical protein [[Acidovorax] ebreus TPSY]
MTHLTHLAPRRPQRQRGVTLLELMVGVVIGLLTVAVAMGALMVSRGISGTVSDASEIQQQGTYAMRVIGQQMRQAGSLKLDLIPAAAQAAAASNAFDHLLPVALEARADPAAGISGDPGWAPATDTIGFLNGGPVVGFANDTTEVLTTGTGSPPTGSQTANCLGQQPSGAATRSNFFLANGELRCGSGIVNDNQPIVRNVAAFQVRYLMQDITTTPGIPQINYAASNATVEAVANGWAKVQAVEVCLELFGNEAIDLPAGSTYTGCAGPVAYDTLTGARARRMHLTFRNVFQLRGQGQTGAVL